jgi:serine/threonine-protein kinase
VEGGALGEARRVLVWVDRKGHETPIQAAPRSYVYPRISPDGTQVAIDIRDEQNDIWLWDFVRETLTRLTSDPGLDRAPAWSRDGKRIAYSSQRDGSEGNIFWRLADGTGTVERLTSASTVRFPTWFSLEGSLVLWEATQKTGWDIRVLEPGGAGPERVVAQTPADELNGEVSPNGRWLAYESTESGTRQVYVRPFPETERAPGRQVSPDGGTRPLWSRDRPELFYLIEPARVMAVPVEAEGDTFAFGTARMVVNGPYITDNALRTYDVSPDGQRFLMIKAAPETSQAEHSVVLVQNWGEELKRLVPVN